MTANTERRQKAIHCTGSRDPGIRSKRSCLLRNEYLTQKEEKILQYQILWVHFKKKHEEAFVGVWDSTWGPEGLYPCLPLCHNLQKNSFSQRALKYHDNMWSLYIWLIPSPRVIEWPFRTSFPSPYFSHQEVSGYKLNESSTCHLTSLLDFYIQVEWSTLGGESFFQWPQQDD